MCWLIECSWFFKKVCFKYFFLVWLIEMHTLRNSGDLWQPHRPLPSISFLHHLVLELFTSKCSLLGCRMSNSFNWPCYFFKCPCCYLLENNYDFRGGTCWLVWCVMVQLGRNWHPATLPCLCCCCPGSDNWQYFVNFVQLDVYFYNGARTLTQFINFRFHKEHDQVYIYRKKSKNLLCWWISICYCTFEQIIYHWWC